MAQTNLLRNIYCELSESGRRATGRRADLDGMTHPSRRRRIRSVIESLESRRLFAAMLPGDVPAGFVQPSFDAALEASTSPPALVSAAVGEAGRAVGSLAGGGWSFPRPTLGRAIHERVVRPLVSAAARAFELTGESGLLKPASKGGGKMEAAQTADDGRASGPAIVSPATPSGATVTVGSVSAASDTLPGDPTAADSPDVAAPAFSLMTLSTVGGLTPTITTPYGTSVIAGNGFHVNGISTVLASGSQSLARYRWDFGDPNGRFNNLEGFNAAHVYETPGQYRVTLTVTDASGVAGSTSMTVNVLADARRKFYVAAGGSDGNDGLSADRPVATVQKALQLAGGSNAQVLLQRGSTFDLASTPISISGSNVLIGAYGSGAAPVIRKAVATLSDLILVNSSASNITVQDVAFDTTTPTDVEKSGAARGVKASGTNLVIRRCTFNNVSDAINGEQQPHGVIVQDNTAPTVTSVRGYFDWVQGSDWVIVGNDVQNSTREHIVRVGGADRVTAESNRFSNQDRTAQGDSKDIAKGTFTLQIGNYLTVQNNNLYWGPMGVGPLGGTDGSNNPSAQISNVVFRENTLYGGSFNVSPGAYNVTFQDNVITANGFAAINITPTDPATNAAGALIYPTRNIANLVFDHNTGFSNSNNGRFINLKSPSAAGAITVTSNLYVAPKLETGYNQNAVLYLQASDLSSFRQISGNIWAAPVKSPNNNSGAAVYLWPTWWDASGYKTPSQWSALQPRGSGVADVFSNVNMPDPSVQVTVPAGSPAPMYSATVNGVTAGSRRTR